MISIRNTPKIDLIKSKSYKLISSSSFHGLPNIVRANKKFIKYIWSLLFLASTSFSIYLVIRAILGYLEYEVVTKIDVINQMPTRFPSVSFFNLRNRKQYISLGDILEECFFNDLACNASDFETRVDKLGNVLYTFNERMTYISGRYYGLTVTLENKAKISNSERFVLDGFRIIVHNGSNDPGYYAGFSNTGVDASPGFLTNIVVDRVFTSKLGEPFNKCLKEIISVNASDSDLYKYILRYTNYSYTQNECFQYCIGRELNKYFNETNEIDNWFNVWNSKYDLFNYSDHQLINIYKNLISSTTLDSCKRLCPLECDSIKYKLSISLSKVIETKTVELEDDYQVDYRNNLTLFSIFYEDLSYTFIEQTQKMTILDLISSIGGVFGLFIGISFLSFLEIFELLFEIFSILLFDTN